MYRFYGYVILYYVILMFLYWACMAGGMSPHLKPSTTPFSMSIEQFFQFTYI